MEISPSLLNLKLTFGVSIVPGTTQRYSTFPQNFVFHSQKCVSSLWSQGLPHLPLSPVNRVGGVATVRALEPGTVPKHESPGWLRSGGGEYDTLCDDAIKAVKKALNMGGIENEEEENKMVALLQTLNELFGLEEKLVALKQYSLDHPIITLCVIVTMGMCSIPIFCFIVFMIGTSLLSFTMFMFIEGTVLTIGTVVLGGALFFVGLMSLGFTAFVIGTFYSFRGAKHILHSVMEKVPSPPCMRRECDTTTKES
ncbi:hypothetical protein FSP39_012462 [Pinctada imbricata]|uniref:Uncharacterized protein n=1 Tax=Pinctada imbricata TaxID=66713 RepID=A0AA89C1A5_PINIB|nr:hypothetical protein FSP39_012462 [Pinctada imbricata]